VLSTMKTDVTHSSEMSATAKKTTWYSSPEDNDPQHVKSFIETQKYHNLKH
jgi:hypothetical protein